MSKEKLVVWVESTMIQHVALEAERRHISMSSLVREALSAASANWAPSGPLVDDLLEGQAELWVNPKRPANDQN